MRDCRSWKVKEGRGGRGAMGDVERDEVVVREWKFHTVSSETDEFW